MNGNQIFHYFKCKWPKLTKRSFISSFGMHPIVFAAVFKYVSHIIFLDHLFVTLYYLKTYAPVDAFHYFFNIAPNTCYKIIWDTISKLQIYLPEND